MEISLLALLLLINTTVAQIAGSGSGDNENSSEILGPWSCRVPPYSDTTRINAKSAAFGVESGERLAMEGRCYLACTPDTEVNSICTAIV